MIMEITRITWLFPQKSVEKTPVSRSNYNSNLHFTGPVRIRFRNKYFCWVSTGVSAHFNERLFENVNKRPYLFAADYSINELLTSKKLRFKILKELYDLLPVLHGGNLSEVLKKVPTQEYLK